MLVYLEKYNTLDTARVILDASHIVALKETGQQFKKYFSMQLASEMGVVVSMLMDEEESSHHSGDVWLPTSQPTREHASLWEILYSQKMLSHVLYQLPCATKRKHQAYLVHAVMRYLEPIIDEDTAVLRLLLDLGWNEPDAALSVFENAQWLRVWSPRALQLSATAMRSPLARGISVTIPCRVRVADMKRGGRMAVRSRRYSVGSTVCYLSCGREVMDDESCPGANDCAIRLYHGMSLYVHLERGTLERPQHGNKSCMTSAGDGDARHGTCVRAKGFAYGTEDGNEESDVLRGCSKVKVWARVSCDGCRCMLNDADDEIWQGVITEKHMEFGVDGLVVSGVQHGWDCLLRDVEVEKWTSRHEDRCSFTVTAVVELVRATGADDGW